MGARLLGGASFCILALAKDSTRPHNRDMPNTTPAAAAETLLTKTGDAYRAWGQANKRYEKALDAEDEAAQGFWTEVAAIIERANRATIRNRLATRTRAR